MKGDHKVVYVLLSGDVCIIEIANMTKQCSVVGLLFCFMLINSNA